MDLWDEARVEPSAVWVSREGSRAELRGAKWEEEQTKSELRAEAKLGYRYRGLLPPLLQNYARRWTGRTAAMKTCWC